MAELDSRAEALLAATLTLLDLPALAGEILRSFVPMELDVEVAQQVRADDPQGRAGVLAWSALCAELAADEAGPTAPEVQQLESGVLVSWMGGDGHTAYYSGSKCIDNAVDDYLVKGEVPEDGLECK